MSLLTDVSTYLDSASISPSLTEGTNLFLGRLMETPDTCVAILQTSGTAPQDVFGSSFPPIENQGLQTLVRAKAYSDAESLAVAVFKELLKVDNQTLSSTLYYKIEASQSPFAFERDEEDRVVMSCNFNVMKILS